MKVVYLPFSRDELVERLREGIRNLTAELPVARAVLFGSWAAGRATAYSDVDLLVVYAGARREDAFAMVLRYVRVRGLEPHVYSEDEARALEETLARMTRVSIPLFPR